MSWNEVIDQQRVVGALRRAIGSQRIAHAYLFHGKDGVGKRAVALAFARTLQCDAGADEPCGTCRPCQKVSRLVHPDVHVLIPHPKDADAGDLAERLRHLAEEPYATIDYVRRPSLSDPLKASNKQAFYSVARINSELRRAMSYKPVEGRYKIALVTDAHLLRTEAANAFLKLLEEPTPQTVFILTTSRVDRLLPTIVSRCQKIRFDLLAAEQIEAALRSRKGVDGPQGATMARMADGSFSRALDLASNEALFAGRQLVLDFFRLAYLRQIDKTADLVEQMARLGREQVKGILGLMLSWMRDLIHYRTMGAAAQLVNLDQEEAIKKFCDHVPQADLEAMVSLVEEAIELTERNLHLPLTLLVLVQALGQAMRGTHSGRLYRPLAEPDVVTA